MAKGKLTDQCLWLSHLEDGAIKHGLASLSAGSSIALLIDGERILFERMATGVDGRNTMGLKPVGQGAVIWRERYSAGEHIDIEVDFAGE